MSETSYETLRSLPEVERLVTILRSDNPLIAIGVTRREVSWTQFLAWLLDPVRHPGRLGPLFLEALLDTAHDDVVTLLDVRSSIPLENAAMLREIAALGGRTVTEVQSAQAEVIGDAKGRMDLLVRCRVGRQPLAVLIENKIRAEESTDQLQGYVEDTLSKLQAEELLLPMLVAVGDDVREAASCVWAVVWNRDRTKRWLELGRERCHAEDLEPPRLVNDYLEVFESWDLASQLRKYHWSLLEKVWEEEPTAVDWRLLNGPLAVSDWHFFQEVAADSVLRKTVRRHDMEVCVDLEGYNDELKVLSQRWTMHPAGTGASAVNVHFEARQRGVLRLDVELYPYEKNIEARGLTQHFAAQIDLKSRLVSALRHALIETRQAEAFSAHKKQLRPADKPDAATAVKFDPAPGAVDSPAGCARHFSDVIEQATPLVEGVVQNLK